MESQFLENASLVFDLSNITKEYKKIEKLKKNEELAKTFEKTTIESNLA